MKICIQINAIQQVFIKHILYAWHYVENGDKTVTNTGIFLVLMKLLV